MNSTCGERSRTIYGELLLVTDASSGIFDANNHMHSNLPEPVPNLTLITVSSFVKGGDFFNVAPDLCLP